MAALTHWSSGEPAGTPSGGAACAGGARVSTSIIAEAAANSVCLTRLVGAGMGAFPFSVPRDDWGE
ncbi:hypothetical protein GCM10027411_08850 [Microbacterium aureliae]